MQTLIRHTVLGAALILLFASCADNHPATRPLVVTSIAPLGDWIAAVGGDAVDVQVLVPPASSPHTFELTPGQLRVAGAASLVVLNGAGLEYWAGRLIENLRDPQTPVLTLGDGVDLLQDGGHHHGHGDHAAGAGNPHFWLDPVVADASVARIADALQRILPDQGDSIRLRARAYREQLQRLDEDIARTAAQWGDRRFIGDHAAWAYFARRYGLVEAGVIEELPGREISARDMAGLIRLMREQDIRTVFADVRKSPRATDILREESGARVARLDPLGSGTGYLEMMRANLREMDRVLR